MICEHRECILNVLEKEIKLTIVDSIKDGQKKLAEKYPELDERCLQRVYAEELKSLGEYLVSELIVEGFINKKEKEGATIHE